MKEAHWDSLVAGLQWGSCVLVLGPDIPAVPRAGSALDDNRNSSIRDAFCRRLTGLLEDEGQKVGEQTLFAVAQQYEDSPATANLKTVAASFFRSPPYDPGPLHQALSRLPFSLVLTTGHDDLFAKALRFEEKSPSRLWYHYKGEPRDNRDVEGKPSPDAPAIYHLYGTFDEPRSLVLTENDLLDFMINVIRGRPKLPDGLQSLLKNNIFLFVGFGIRYWYIRVLLKLLIKALEFSSGSVALESLSELNDQEREQTVLFYRRGTRLEVVEMEAIDFVEQLLERLRKAGGYQGASQRPLRRAQVFISYERNDQDVASKLYEALPKDRFDVWLDMTLLQGGEDWNQELEDKIASSDSFLVLNSKNLADKAIGYVNKEIRIALDLQRYRQRGVEFIIPLQVDGIPAEEGQRDLQRFHQLPLRRSSFAADVAQITKKISRDFQRMSRDPHSEMP
jgi:hypothetical protein